MVLRSVVAVNCRRSARSEDRSYAGLWRNAASSQVDRQRPGIATHSVRRNHRRARSLSHWPGERSRPSCQLALKSGSDTQPVHLQRSSRREVLHRGGKQGIGYEPRGGLAPGSFPIRDLRGDRRQERRNICFSCEARSKVPGALARPKQCNRASTSNCTLTRFYDKEILWQRKTSFLV